MLTEHRSGHEKVEQYKRRPSNRAARLSHMSVDTHHQNIHLASVEIRHLGSVRAERIHEPNEWPITSATVPQTNTAHALELAGRFESANPEASDK